jgi:hypothetical protein
LFESSVLSDDTWIGELISDDVKFGWGERLDWDSLSWVTFIHELLLYDIWPILGFSAARCFFLFCLLLCLSGWSSLDFLIFSRYSNSDSSFSMSSRLCWIKSLIERSLLTRLVFPGLVRTFFYGRLVPVWRLIGLLTLDCFEFELHLCYVVLLFFGAR